jgi:kynurenine formamidase
LRTVDQIDLKEAIAPLVVLDVDEKVAKNPDYTITMDDVKAWEAKHREIPEGAFMPMRTDWSKPWPNAAAMRK